MSILPAGRLELIRKGRRLQYLTVAYNCVEGSVSLAAGLAAGSISLFGFGIDSLIEVASGGAVLWRLRQDRDKRRTERDERLTLRIVGICFLALSLYILWESAGALLSKQAPEKSVVGIVIAALSVVIMPVLARAKRRVATALDSAAMQADSRQSDFCMYLSAILLAGLLLNWTLGWWWADPVASLTMLPIIGREGYLAVRARHCCSECPS